MPQSLRLRHANRLVGAFVLLAGLIVVGAAFVAPQTRRWFTPVHRLVIRLPAQGSLGLRPGADVLVLGSVVGSVDDIVVNDAGDMVADISIRGNFARFIKADSKAIVRRPLGIGDAIVEITRGYTTELPSDRPVLQADADKAPSELIEETLSDIRQEAVPALHEARQTIAQYGALAGDLRDRQTQVKQTLDHVNAIADSVEHGDGFAAALVSDPKVSDDLRKSIAGLRVSIDKSQSVLDESTKALQSITRTTNDLPGLVMQTQETMRQMQRLAEAMQQSWLLRTAGANAPAQPQPLGAERMGADR
jgi:phospholipid/cholesterol/gamma-HCH transport system substrate-binding protein